MAIFLGLLLFSFIFTSLALIPFIDLLYELHFAYRHQLPANSALESQDFAKLTTDQNWKIGTPVGGGILLIFVVTLLYVITFPLLNRLGLYVTSAFNLKEELNVIFFTFISFGLLGLYDDLVKMFNLHHRNILGLPVSTRTVIKFFLSFVVACLLFFNLGLKFIHLPFIGAVNITFLYIPLVTLIIYSFSRAFNITDGLDGLACGLLLISLLAFWTVSLTFLDTLLSVFIALWVGALIAFLYFNVFPARIWLGNAGSLSFGATLAVIGIILGKIFPLLIVGGVFVIEAIFLLLQKLSILFFHRRLFRVTPLHYWLESLGWPEPKVVMRVWLAGLMLAIIGLWFAAA